MLFCKQILTRTSGPYCSVSWSCQEKVLTSTENLVRMDDELSAIAWVLMIMSKALVYWSEGKVPTRPYGVDCLWLWHKTWVD